MNHDNLASLDTYLVVDGAGGRLLITRIPGDPPGHLPAGAQHAGEGDSYATSQDNFIKDFQKAQNDGGHLKRYTGRSVVSKLAPISRAPGQCQHHPQ